MIRQASGRYADGKVAALRDVGVVADAAGLSILDPDIEHVVTWPSGDVRLVGTPEPNGTVRLCRVGDHARLTVSDPDFIAYIRENLPSLHDGAYGKKIPAWKIVAWTGGAFASLALFFFVIIPAFSQYAVALVPAALENRAGIWMADGLISQLANADGRRNGKAVCATAAGTAALDRMVSALRTGGTFPHPINVRVANSSLINAFALPGGQIIVLRGLLDFSNHPNQVAGVLAHELAHVEYRHPLQIAIEGSSGGFLVALLLGDVVGFSTIASLSGALLLSHYSQEMETAADQRGLASMRAANFATAPLGDFFTRLSAKEGDMGGFLSLLSTHPGSADRASLAVADGNRGSDALDPPSWTVLRKICD